jgi:hypothetical protein
MTSMLPPTRDLPPGRHTQIRAELERAAGGRRGSSRLAVSILAAAAAVAVVVTGVAVLRPDPTDPAPAVLITSSPPTTQTTADFGLPPEEVKAIEEGCAKSAGVGKATLRQLMIEETRWALLYTEKESLSCTIGVGGKDYNSGFGQVALHWLPGHFSVDDVSANSGGARRSKPSDAGSPGFRTLTGRIDAKVARVTISADDRTVDARIANGTYAARLYYPPFWAIPQNDKGPVVRAYDAAGTLLGTSSELWEACFFDPDNGAIVYGDRRKTREQCQVATPWK